MKTTLLILVILLFACQKNNIEPEFKGFISDSIHFDINFPGYYWMYGDNIPFQYWDLVQTGMDCKYIGIVVAIYSNYFVTQYFDGDCTPGDGSIFIHIGSVGDSNRVIPR